MITTKANIQMPHKYTLKEIPIQCRGCGFWTWLGKENGCSLNGCNGKRNTSKESDTE